MTEVLFTFPAGRSFGARTTALIAPGLNFAGEGWEFIIEALVPATRATAGGAGVRVQLHLALDFLFPRLSAGRCWRPAKRRGSCPAPTARPACSTLGHASHNRLRRSRTPRILA